MQYKLEQLTAAVILGLLLYALFLLAQNFGFFLVAVLLVANFALTLFLAGLISHRRTKGKNEILGIDRQCES